MSNGASLLTDPLFIATDSNGNPLAGGKVYTYQAGTLIPLATYTDATLTVPNTNPVILDEFGSAQIWLGSAVYKLNLLDVNGVQQANFPIDNLSTPTVVPVTPASLVSYLPPFTGSVTINQAQKNSEFLHVIEFGAVGDGITNDGPAIQSAMAAAITFNKILLFDSKTYAYSTYISVTLGTNQVLSIEGNGATLAYTGVDAGSYPVPPAFFYTSIVISGVYNVNGNGSKALVRNLNVTSTLSGSPSISRTRGYLCGIRLGYLAQVDMGNVNVSGFPFENIWCYYIDQLFVRECSGINSCYAGLIMQSCQDIKVIGGVYNQNGGSDPTIEGYGVTCATRYNSTDRDNTRISIFGVTAIGNVGKGIDAHDALELSIRDCKIRDFTLNGIYADNQGTSKNVANIIIQGNDIDGTTSQGNTSAGQSGIQVGGFGTGDSYIGSVQVKDNAVRNITNTTTGTIGILIDSPQSVSSILNLQITGNVLENACANGSGASAAVIEITATTSSVNASGTSGTSVLTINSVTGGAVAVGQTLSGNANVTAGTTITSFGTFNGTSGTVNLSVVLGGTITGGSVTLSLLSPNVNVSDNSIYQSVACAEAILVGNAARATVNNNTIWSTSTFTNAGIFLPSLGRWSSSNNHLTGTFSNYVMNLSPVDGNSASGNTYNSIHIPHLKSGIFEDWQTVLPTAAPLPNLQWVQGSYVHNLNPSNASGQVSIWLRITTGAGNVLNTDWRAAGVTI